jgi:1,2-diacylglycerol 3-alpha-glucosyltransferase
MKATLYSNKVFGVFNDSYPPLMDGVAVATKNYAFWLNRLQYASCVVTPKTPSYVNDEPFPVYRYASLPLLLRKPYRLGIPEIDVSFNDKLDRIPFALLHAHCPFSSGHLALKIAKERKIPIVATFHSKYRDDFARVLHTQTVLDILMKELISFYEKVDEVWIPQAAVEDTIRAYGFKGNVRVVENGSDMTYEGDIETVKANARKQLGVSDDCFCLLFVGQHIWEKNTELIIRSLAQLKDVNYKMFFVGTGYAVDEMKALVDALSISSKVEFVGLINDREILKMYYAAADIFLFPSLYDNAPLVLREAAVFHTPGVLVEGSTAAEVVQDNVNGFLIQNNTESLVACIRKLNKDKESVFGVGMQASCTLTRSWENVMHEVAQHYERLIYDNE